MKEFRLVYPRQEGAPCHPDDSQIFSPATKAVYDAQCKAYSDWCAEKGVAPIPWQGWTE